MTQTFANAVRNQGARTENGMRACKNTTNACVDLFFKIGAMRGKDPIPAFVAAYVENPEIATRIALWARDARQGAGEREIFRRVLKHAAKNLMGDELIRLIEKSPELGRWDDLLVLLEDGIDADIQGLVYSKIGMALIKGDGLCAKWMPRQGPLAVKLRTAVGMTPKQWRKTLVNATKVVETQMCANDWDNINFNHVPSVAAARYKKAFGRHTTKYGEWAAALVKNDPKVAKVNAGAVYPYDVIKGMASGWNGFHTDFSKADLQVITAQWEALPNYIGDASILPLVDTSGSMTSQVTSNPSLRYIDVAVGLGLYCADKNKGKFKDIFLTFSAVPQMQHLEGNIVQKVNQMSTAKWEMNTNLHAALDKILQIAKDGGVPREEMPNTLLIMSDMQFDQCVRFDDSAFDMIKRKYKASGYQMPGIVFWNLNASDNVPVKFNTRGVALVSGFSPSIMKSVLSSDMENMTPEGIMLRTVMQERYN